MTIVHRRRVVRRFPLSKENPSCRPLVVLANYAMHYYGTSPVSADFCGRFGDRLADLLGVEAVDPSFVGIMSQETSGFSVWMDYCEPAPILGTNCSPIAELSTFKEWLQL